MDAFRDFVASRPGVWRTVSFVDHLSPPETRELAEQLPLVLEFGDDNGELARLLAYDRSWAIVRVYTTDIGSRRLLAR